MCLGRVPDAGCGQKALSLQVQCLVEDGSDRTEGAWMTIKNTITAVMFVM